MKKYLILITVILLTYYFISLFIQKNNLIPNESIRIRVIANSNSDYDQKIKKIVSNNLMFYLNNELKDLNNINDVRNKINNSLDKINFIVEKVLKKNNYNLDYKIYFGYNYFPTKKIKNNTFNEGLYESLLITLGTGLGENFWCLLFPPLCLLDDEKSEIEYTSFFNEIFEF